MKMAGRLGLFVALALVASGCGSGGSSTPDMGAPAAQSDAAADKTAEPTAQGDTDRTADGSDADKASSDGGANAEGNGAGGKGGAGSAGGGAGGSSGNGAGGGSGNGAGGSSGSGAGGGSSNGAGGGSGNGAGGSSGSGAGGGSSSGAGGGSSSGAGGGSSSGAGGSSGNGGGGGSGSGTFAMYVTHHFGSSSVFNQQVGATGNLLDVMMNHLEVETAYGGTFVNGINGTSSAYTNKSIFTRKKRDWFYYHNGSIGAVAADAIQPRPGDMVWWDYHDWSGEGGNTPTVIGTYPHPFTTGYGGATPGTVIYYGGAHASDAERLAQALRNFGAGNVRTAPYNDAAANNPSTNAIVLGTWSEVGSQPAVQEAFGDATKTGVFARYADGTFKGMDTKGNESSAVGKGAILSYGNGSGDTTPLWLVVGTDEAALDAALDVMIQEPGKLRGKSGAVLNGRTVLGVPVMQ